MGQDYEDNKDLYLMNKYDIFSHSSTTIITKYKQLSSV